MLSQTNRSKQVPIVYWVILIVFLVGACGTLPPEQASNATATTAPTFTHDVETPATLPTFTPAALPTLPDVPPPTVQPTRTPLPASLPKFPLDGYVMLFTKDDNLYFQDGENTPIQLTQAKGASKYHVRLSNDNQKVVYYEAGGDIYSINTVGTQEKIIIPKNWLDSLEMGTQIRFLNFVPKTHLLFVETMLCKEKSSVSLCSTIIFLADTDIGEIRKLADLGLALQNHDPIIQDNIRFSPDGKMMAVGTMGGVAIFTLDGKIIRENILPYTPSEADVPFPSLFWLPDSSGLLVALPDKNRPDPFYVDGTAPAYTIWRYKIEDNSTAQIPFDPPVAGTFEVSPDGNWIVYGGLSPAATELYLGNLADGSAKAFGNDLMRNFQWSSDSKYFIHGNAVVISFDKPPVLGGGSTQWIDSNHFIYFDSTENNPAIQQKRILIGEIRGNEVYYYESGLPYSGLSTIKPKQ